MRFYLFSKEDFVISVVKSERTNNANICYLAGELEYKIIRMTLNEKYFPKRAIFIIANMLIDSITDVSANFFAANAIYPNNEEKLKIREQYQIIGKSNLSALEHQLNVANQLFNIPDGVLNEIFGLTSQINKKYNNWFKSGRKVLNRELLKQQPQDELIENEVLSKQ